MSIRLAPTFGHRLASSSRTLAGVWLCSGSPIVAEICAASGLDWVLIDMEHSPNGLESLLAQLQAVAAYPVTPVVRVPSDDPVMIKQVLDVGAQNILVPMISSVEQARAAVSAARYPPAGRRGVGSALARSSRWNMVDDYLAHAATSVSVFVQVETVDGVEAAAAIAAVDGVDGVLVGPSDLAASMGLLGQQGHPDVVESVIRALRVITATGKPAGVNAFAPEMARTYVRASARFVIVGADVAMLARGSEQLAQAWQAPEDGVERASY